MLTSQKSRYYQGMAALMLLLIVLGFIPAISHRLSTSGTMPITLMIHGFVFLAWYLLFFYQTRLIYNGQVASHRKLGQLSPYLAVAMVITAIIVMVQAFRMESNGGTPFEPKHFIMLPFNTAIMTALLFWLGYRNRMDGAAHKRYMLMLGLLILDPATGRIGINLIGIPPAGIVIQLILILSVLWHDKRTLGYVHRVSKICLGIFIVHLLLFMGLGPSEAWANFVTALLGVS